jgi:hypothetical protein
MTLKILPSALEDLANGREFYARQSITLGIYFLDSLFADIDSLELFGGVHREIFGHHRLLAKRFPFAIYYKLDGSSVIVHRVLDCRQEPRKTRQSLQSAES